MHFLTEQYIKSLVKKESTYLKGLRIYKSNQILELYQTAPHRPDSDDLYFKASILGSQIYNLNIKLEKEGKQISASCECPSYFSYSGNCKHITAALLYIKEHHFKDTQISEDINQLVNIYKNSKSQNIDLKPSFIFTYGKCGIDLKIGKSQYYVVKNIKNLFQLLKYGEYFQYGKNLAFHHKINNFNKKSRKLLKYITNDIESKNGEYYNYPFDNRRQLEVHPLCITKILETYDNEQLEFTIQDELVKLTYLNEEPPITFVFDDGKLTIKEDFELVLLQSIGFYVYEDKIYNLDKVSNQNLIPLVNYIKNNKYLAIDENTANKFFGLIFPKIKDGMNIENEEELHKLNTVKDLLIKVYLDIKDGILYLDYKFYYGDLEKNEAIVKGEFTNEEAEDNFIDYLYELGFDTEDLSMEDDEMIFNFLVNQIDGLKEYAEVYISDTIKKLNIRQMKQPSVGVRFDNNLLEVSFSDLDFDIQDLDKVLKSYQLKRKFYKLKDGSVIILKEDYMNLLNETYDALNLQSRKLSDVNFVEPYKAVKFSNILEQVHDEGIKIKEFITNLLHYDKTSYNLDFHFDSILRPYQKVGFKWLMNLANYGLGGILADEMGLGKTIQIIALLNHDETDKPSLIVTPASLIYNWEYEFKQFAPNSNVTVIDGNISERKEAIKNIKGKQFIITSYDYLKRDIEFYHDLKFRFCVIDEAQNIKNQTTKNAISVKTINAEVNFALTGTPIENALSDLWSIFDFILPGYFKTYDKFKKDYEVDIVKNNNDDKLKSLAKQIAPFILRRTKKEVLSELPPKVEQVIYAKMDEEQKQVYQALLLSAKRKILDPNANKFVILSYLTRLRQICCDPNLIYDSYIGESPKLELTATLVQESIEAGHKILIFSQFTSMLDLISKKLDDLKIPYLTLIGETPTKERLELVNKFNNDDNTKVFLISLKAGGLGLNLTSADMIIHYDPWWNVSAENQASDRAHRIGQTKTVQVMKLIMKDSIEEKIIKLQERKKNLVDQVINDEEKLLSKLTYSEILSLFE